MKAFTTELTSQQYFAECPHPVCVNPSIYSMLILCAVRFAKSPTRIVSFNLVAILR